MRDSASVSPFLALPPSAWVASNTLAFAIRDAFPVSPGHTLVITRRLVPDWFSATAEERAAIMALVDQVKQVLDATIPRPDGYNVGFNAGEAAGQTVMHLHVHVIPRFRGDMADPRGGVRGVIPAKQNYLPLAPATKDKPFAALPPFVHGDDLHFETALREALLVADRADVVSAFLMTSGVQLLLDDLRDALRRGTRIRLLTGDYLGVSSADALRMLLRLADEQPGFSPFFYETEGGTSFHPKSYLFFRGAHGVAYVGSSNLSRSALQEAVEWNLRLISSDDEATFAAITRRFDALLASPRTKPLTRALIDAYEARAPVPQPPSPEPRVPAPTPNAIQLEAFDALKKSRRAGHSRGLVVLATGVGKTLLAAFDAKAMGSERVLFVAHREEILGQAKNNWQRVFPEKVVGTYQGGTHERDVDLLFASVQTLSRASHLSQFAAEHFDYVVIDEFHHAAASTYRKILGHFRPRFLLALTATPERMDGRSLLDLCGDNLVYRRDLVHGISRRLLVPFHYFGVKDTVDFEPIPWRSGKFDATALTTAVATEERAEHALAEYEKHAGTGTRRTLCFCCTVEHADYMAAFFRRRGKTAQAVHSGPSSAPRAACLRDLASGALEIVCAVDVFNEGLDVPEVNTVLMLRPTESPVIFLQQLGRGLRLAAGKTGLVVIDFIGNHRSFLTKPQSLLYLLGQDLPTQVALEKIRDHALELPEGCSIDIELEAINLLKTMVQQRPSDIVVYEYVSFRDANGRRPSAAELFAAGVGFAPIKEGHESWFHFVATQGDLTPEETRVLQRHAAWFGDLLRTRMTKAYKMLALRALLDADALFTGMEVAESARRAFESVREDMLLFREMREDEGRRTLDAAFVRSWRDMPLAVWARGESTSQRWFTLDGDRFAPAYQVASEDREVFEEMTQELVELRLKQHRDSLLRKSSIDASQAPIILTVSHSNHRPILRFDRSRRTDIPEGPVAVQVDGETYTFSFQKIAVNVATRETGSENVLPEVLRRLLGPSTGQPGIRHYAQLVRDDDVWRLERVTAPDVGASAEVLPFPKVPFYRDVKVACGAFDPTTQQDEAVEQFAVNANVAVDPKTHFVVTATGDSMNGGLTPIADGSLVLCEWARGVSAESVQGKPFLLVGHDEADTTFAVMKVPRLTKDGWVLESWNPEFGPQKLPAATKLEPVARVVEVIERARGLVLWGEYNRDAIAKAFGSENNPSWRVGHRDIDVQGKPHTILMVTLRKSTQTKMEHRYADRFLSPTELQWESQASTKLDSLKGRRIVGHEQEGRAVHLFVQYDSHQDFTYLGTLRYLGHEGETPMRVRFQLGQALPEALWKMWS
jgi:superfamily II DNA or RNA helicase/diadenosine tetraphosphate (Ap4A) HIT family hydrolase/SOS-response transcriptional repressor LexA